MNPLQDVDEQAAGHARQDVLLQEEERRRQQSQDSLGQSSLGGELGFEKKNLFRAKYKIIIFAAEATEGTDDHGQGSPGGRQLGQGHIGREGSHNVSKTLYVYLRHLE